MLYHCHDTAYCERNDNIINKNNMPKPQLHPESPKIPHKGSQKIPSILNNQLGFQRLYLEYYSFLYDLDAKQITLVYRQGLNQNLKASHFNSEVLHYIKNEIYKAALGIERQKDNCKSRKQAHHYQQATSEESSSYLQSALLKYLNSSDQPENRQEQDSANAALAELLDEHHAYLEKNSEDIFAQFNLAWIHFHLQEDYEHAKEHLTEVINKSLLNDSPITQMALRYLAMCDYLLDNHAEATASLQRAASLDQTNNLYLLYEIAQQLIHTDKKDAAISHLKALIKHSPLFFVHIQSDPFFTDIPEVDALLTRFHTAKLEEIKEITYKKWLDSETMKQALPQEFDHQALFNSTFEEHRTLLTHQPYPLLCKTEKISDKLLRNLLIKTKTELNAINQQLTQSMKLEQTRWKVINLIGVALVYIAVLLTLASIFLFIGGDLLGLTSEEQTIDWGKLVPKIFATVLGTGIIGILLLRLNPPKLKQLAKKKDMLDKANQADGAMH